MTYFPRHPVPQTHLGRLAAVLCMMMGPMLVSIMTAAFSRNMALNARETRLMATLDRDKLEAKVIVTATRIIQSWVRGRLAESRARGAARTASTRQLMSNFGVRLLTANDHEGDQCLGCLDAGCHVMQIVGMYVLSTRVG